MMNTGVDIKPLLAASVIVIAVVLLAFAFSNIKGPASLCDDAGGQILVGPGGETSCVSNQTFVPLESLDGNGKPD